MVQITDRNKQIFDLIEQHMLALHALHKTGRIHPLTAWRDQTSALYHPWTAETLEEFQQKIEHPLPTDLAQLLAYSGGYFFTGWELVENHVPQNQYEVPYTPQPPEGVLGWSMGPRADGSIQPENTRSLGTCNAFVHIDADGIQKLDEAREGWAAPYETQQSPSAADAQAALDALKSVEGFLPSEGLDDLKAMYQSIVAGTYVPPEQSEDEKAHDMAIHAFMQRGFPFASAPNGDWLAIEGDHILHISHEGEEAGIVIDLPLPEFLLHQAMLGFPGLDFPEIFQFSEVEEAADSAAVISHAKFRATSDIGQAWRNWFWDGVAVPEVPTHLLEPSVNDD